MYEAARSGVRDGGYAMPTRSDEEGSENLFEATGRNAAHRTEQVAPGRLVDLDMHRGMTSLQVGGLLHALHPELAAHDISISIRGPAAIETRHLSLDGTSDRRPTQLSQVLHSLTQRHHYDWESQDPLWGWRRDYDHTSEPKASGSSPEFQGFNCEGPPAVRR